MKPENRRMMITKAVELRGSATVDGLAEEFLVSAETIRRDLSRLARSGRILKVHGGARRIGHFVEGSFQERMADNARAKEVIAGKLPGIVESGDILFIDTGTTTLACSTVLAETENLTIVTNSFQIARVFGRSASHKVYLLGGRFSADNEQTLGAIAIEGIDRFRADHAILTIAALDPIAGAMDADFDEAQIARAMIRQARNIVVVADKDKLRRQASFRVCRLNEINMLVCDDRPDQAFVDVLNGEGVQMK